MIKYTIIIPHHNIPELLKRCIDSIPNNPEIQIIVVDDNSKDGNNYLKKYSFLNRDNLLFISTKEGRGAGYARNIGLSKAKGKWLLFADADDFFTNDFLDLIEENYNSEADVIFFNVRSVYSDNITQEGERNIAKQKLFNEYKQTGYKDNFRLRYPEPWGKMIKHDLVLKNNIKFDETRVANDYYFSVKVGCLAQKIKVVDKPLYVITVRRGSLSYLYGDTKDKLITRIEVGVRVYKFISKKGFNENPMPIRGLMVLLLKHYPFTFLYKLIELSFKGIPIHTLLYQIFSPKYRNSND